MRYPHIPLIFVESDEQDPTWHLNQTISSLAQTVSSFESTLRLLDQCEGLFHRSVHERKQYRNHSLRDPVYEALTDKMADAGRWANIAACSAAMEVHQFGICLDEIFAVLPLCKTVASQVSEEELRKAAKQFRKNFPHAESIRNGVAHTPELAVRQSWRKAHSFSGTYNGKTNLIGGAPITDLMIIASLHGRTLQFTWKNKLLEFDVTAETLHKLEAVKNKIFEAFSVVEEAMIENGVKRRQAEIIAAQSRED